MHGPMNVIKKKVREVVSLIKRRRYSHKERVLFT